MIRSIKIYPVFFILFLFLSIILPSLSYADVDSFSATLIDFEGDVSIIKGETKEWLDVEMNMPIQKEDNIITGEASYAEIFMDDGSTIKVEESSEVNLRELTFDEDTHNVKIEIFLKAGILLANIAEAIQRSPSVKVYTNTAVAGVRGTEFVVDATDPEETSIGVFSGEVEAFSLDEKGNTLEKEPVSIEAGYQTNVLKNKPPVRPFFHKRRMLLHENRMNALRLRSIQRRKRIPEIIRKRRIIKRRVIMRYWRNIQNKPPNQGASPGAQPAPNAGTPQGNRPDSGPAQGPRPPIRRPPPPR